MTPALHSGNVSPPLFSRRTDRDRGGPHISRGAGKKELSGTGDKSRACIVPKGKGAPIRVSGGDDEALQRVQMAGAEDKRREGWA